MFTNLTFDLHLLNTKAGQDAGAAFQEFTADVLAIQFGRRLHRYSAHGVDGGMDCVIQETGARTLVECKFIGGELKVSPLNRWRYTTGKNLKANLPSPKPSKQYRPWFSKTLVVKRYLYCFSVPFVNEGERQETVREIKSFFNDLSETSGLEHLRHIEVEAWSWDDLRACLERDLQRLHWWFPNLVEGFTPLRQPRSMAATPANPNKQPFRDYLEEGVMPYYSRKTFLASHDRVPVKDEDGLLDELMEKRLLILTGKGGMGKSRLTLELGRLAVARGWSVYKAKPSVQARHLEALMRGQNHNALVLVLVDYVETQQYFREVAEWVEGYDSQHRGSQLHLIANCREHFFGQLRRYDSFRLGLNDGTDAFQRVTVQHILQHAWGKNPPAQMVEECASAPILAVFAAYLRATGRGDQLNYLLQDRTRNFTSWFHKRFQMTLGEPGIPEKLSILAALLPLSASGLDVLVDDKDFSHLYTILVRDGWINENEDDGAEMAHDVLADQLLLEGLRGKGSPRFRKAFLRDVFETAVRFHGLPSLLIALERVGEDEWVVACQPPELLRGWAETNPQAMKACRGKLMGTALLSFEDKRQWLRDEVFWHGAALDEDFRAGLVELGQVVRKEGDGRDLVRWIQAALEADPLSTRLLQLGLNLAPETFRQQALAFLEQEGGAVSGFVMMGWLGGGLPVGEIAGFLEAWQRGFSGILSFGYLARAWLDVQPDALGRLKPHCLSWLKRFGRHPHAGYLMKGWLDAGGDPEEVRTYLKPWLHKYPLEMETSFVMKAWLVACGDRGEVKKYLIPWLNQYPLEMETNFVMKAWLDAGGDRGEVKNYLIPWLNQYPLEMETSFVMTAWLDAGGDPAEVRDYLKPWLNQYPLDMETSFVMKAWLDAGGDLSMILPFCEPWLEAFATAEQAHFVITAWLKGDGDKSKVARFLGIWLQNHGTKTNADFVIRAWLDAGGDYEMVQLEARAWLAEHWREQHAVYITKVLARQPSLPPESVAHILGWCWHNAGDPDALWRFTQLKEKAFFEGLEKMALAAFDVIFQQLNNTTLKEITHSQIVMVLNGFTNSSAMQFPGYAKSIDRFFLDYLRIPGSFPPSIKTWPHMQRKPLLICLTRLLETGKLAPEKDHQALARFFQWMVHCWSSENLEKVQSEIFTLNEKFPNNTFIPNELFQAD